MAHDQRNSPPARGEDASPHQEDMRSRHDLDEERHHRNHYDHHDDRRERAEGDGHHRSTGDRDANDRREDHHHREDMESRRYRHDDHHEYPEDNHHSDRNGTDRRDNPDRHDEPRHHAPDERPTGENRVDERDRSDDRHRNGTSGADERENHDHPHSRHQSSPNRPDGPDAPDNGNASNGNGPSSRHDIRSHSPSHHPQQHDPNSMQDTGVAPSSDQPNSSGDDGSLVNLFVRNVAKHVQENQLIDLFSKYGKVDSAVVVRDPHSRECRGFGFVKMTSDKDAQLAVDALHDFEFEGRQISVERAKRNGPHSRTPGAYMGLDRRIRDRYAGIKRSREYAYAYVGGPYAPPPPSHYPPYRPPPRYHDGPRPRHDYRSMHPPPPPPEFHRGHPPPPMNPRGYDQRGPSDERDRQRRRYESDGGAPRYSPRGDPPPRDQRVDGRDPPVPRESAEDMI